MITSGLSAQARGLLLSVARDGTVPPRQVEAVAGIARRLLALPEPDAQPLRICGARIAAALLGLAGDDVPPTYASARCGRILQEATQAERLEYALSLAIPPVPAHARPVLQ